MQENVRLLSFHEFDVVLSHLEWCLFEVEVAWRVRNHKTEVYVNNVSHIINQYIIIVPILHLEDVLV